MGSSFWLFVGCVILVPVICDAIVKIYKASKSSPEHQGRINDLEEQLQDAEADLEDALVRIEVLEKIVTDEKYDLKREIDGLAN